MNHHGAGLRTLLGDAEVPRALVRDYRSAPVSDADGAMLAYAVKLTSTPHAVTSEDMSVLRSHGFDDDALLDICQVTSYYNYVNRLADGLGVELEPYWGSEELTLTWEEFEARAGAPPAREVP